MLTTSRSALITSPHPTATRAGLAILRAGGNAIEAAIATAATLAVVFPHMTGLGGDACWLIGRAPFDCRGILGIGQAAAGIVGTPLAQRGPQATLTTPGAVASWDAALSISRAEGGRLSLAQLLGSAIHAATDGYPVGMSQAFWHRAHREALREQPGFAAVFEPDGDPPVAGQIQRQPLLAHTLRTLARDGLMSFYEGAVATALADGLAAAGSPLGAADLAATRASIVDPLRTPYRAGELLGLPPPTQGITALQILGVMNRFDVAAMDPVGGSFYALVMSAVRHALGWRHEHLADPRLTSLPEGLSNEQLDAWARMIRNDTTGPRLRAGQAADTVWIGVRDAGGLNVSLIQSLFFDFGSGVVAGATGVLWHNRCAAFSDTPDHPNAPAPGKRPAHTLAPAMYGQDGRITCLYGSQGGDGQPQTQAQILSRHVDFGFDALSALAAPRAHFGPTFLDKRNTLKVEGDVPRPALGYLGTLFPVETVSPLNMATGEAGMITIQPSGWLCGAHDPRGDGLCLGL